jgi:antitoxin MazE
MPLTWPLKPRSTKQEEGITRILDRREEAFDPAVSTLYIHDMRARIQRWGNSLAVRLPKSVAESVGLAEGSEVGVEQRDGELVLRPVHRRYRLDELLAEVRPKQLHAEVATGAARGKEAW